MSEDTAIVRSGMPSMSIQDAITRYNTVIEFTKRVMKADKDYGTIPGTDKPTLLKPGAEKLCSLFGLAPFFVPISEQVDFDKGFFYFRYRCELTKAGEIIATGVGSCNSHEKKYRYRNIPEWKATDAEKAAAIRKDARKDKNGKPYNMLVVENQDPADLVNTIDKMAQKRALIAAILIAANASEFFTQDMEDIADIVDGESHEIISPSQAEHLPEQPKTNGNTLTIYQAVVDAGLSENEHSAREALKKCQKGYDTPEKAIAWMRLYRAWRDTGGDSKIAADHANKGKLPE